MYKRQVLAGIFLGFSQKDENIFPGGFFLEISHLTTLIICALCNAACSGLATGIYTTNSPEACWYIAHSAECNVIVVDSDKQLQKILQVRDRLPQLRAIIQYNEPLRHRYDNVYTV